MGCMSENRSKFKFCESIDIVYIVYRLAPRQVIDVMTCHDCTINRLMSQVSSVTIVCMQRVRKPGDETLTG